MTLLILDNFYNSSPKITSKIIIQIFFILLIPDILWIIYFTGAWTHLSKEERAKINIEESEDIVNFWDSLWFIHGLVYFLAFIELILKGLLLYYLIYMSNSEKNAKEPIINNIKRINTLTNNSEATNEFEIKINTYFYILGMIIILITYIGPYFYYKIIQKKSFNLQKNIGVKHAI